MSDINPKYIEIHKYNLLKCSLNEINWYPFFWKEENNLAESYFKNLISIFEKMDKTKLPRSVEKYKKYSQKLKKHVKHFIYFRVPIYKWFWEFFSILFYLIKLLSNSYFYRRIISIFIFNKQKRKNRGNRGNYTYD